eukprot:g5160.t1
MSGQFTCNACDVVFQDARSHRTHYKLDWHRYNLRRRQIELAPIPFQVFEDRKQAVLAKRREATEMEEAETAVYRCMVCRKTFASENVQRQHMGTKKHKKKAAAAAAANEKKALQACKKCPVVKEEKTRADRTAMIRITASTDVPTAVDQCVGDDGEGSPIMNGGSSKKSEDLDSSEDRRPTLDRERRLDAFECLFCNVRSSDMSAHLSHMQKKHEFTVPESQFVANMPGLTGYFAEKVGVGMMCLCCQRGFGSISAVKSHMVDMGHCRIPFEVGYDFEEYMEFYKYDTLEKGKSSEAACAWHAAVAKCREDGEIDPSIARFGTLEIDENEELVLDDGRRVGHRKYKHIYKQRFVPLDDRPEVVANRRSLLERCVGPDAASALIASAMHGSDRRKPTGRSAALSLFHKHDRVRAQDAAARATEHKKRVYDRHALTLGIQTNKVNVSKIPHRRGVFISWKK